MNTRQYLEQVQDSERRIQNKIQEEYRLRLLATSISSFSNGDKVQTSGGKDRVGDAVTRIVELQQEIASDVKGLAELQMKVSGDINDMENSMYSSLLHKRYIEFKNLVTVADEMGYSVQHIRSCHCHAILPWIIVCTLTTTKTHAYRSVFYVVFQRIHVYWGRRLTI